MSAESPVLELRVVLTVEDYDKAMRFYRDALGLPFVREFGEGEAKGALLAAGVVATIELVTRAAADEIDTIETGKASGAPIRLAMEVADSVGTAAKLAAAGWQAGEPVTTPWQHRNVRLTGPDDMQITLFTVVKD